MAQRPDNHDNEAETPFIIDPSAEKQARSTKSAKAKPANDLSPTGKEEEDFFHNAGEQFKLQHRGQDLGWLGKFFGSGNSAPTNIAGLIAIFGVIVLFISFLIPVTSASIDAQRLADAQKIVGGLISSALSFIFGAASKK